MIYAIKQHQVKTSRNGSFIFWFFYFILFNKNIADFFFYRCKIKFDQLSLATTFFFISCITYIPYRHLKDIFKNHFSFFIRYPPHFFSFRSCLSKMLLFKHAHSHDVYHQDWRFEREFDLQQQHCTVLLWKRKILEQVGDLSAD